MSKNNKTQFQRYWSRIDNCPNELEYATHEQLVEVKQMVKQAFHSGHGMYHKKIKELQLFPDGLQAEINEAAERIENVEAKYSELLLAVCCKSSNETRHATALRYINERVSMETGPESAQARHDYVTPETSSYIGIGSPVDPNKPTHIEKHSVGQATYEARLRSLEATCKAAIKAGDWVVDGACDPDLEV